MDSEFKRVQTFDALQTIAKEVTIVVRSVKVGKIWVEAEDLAETLTAVKDGDTVVTNRSLGDELIKLGVLSTLGSDRAGYPAREGPNFDTFLHALKQAGPSMGLTTDWIKDWIKEI